MVLLYRVQTEKGMFQACHRLVKIAEIKKEETK